MSLDVPFLCLSFYRSCKNVNAQKKRTFLRERSNLSTLWLRLSASKSRFWLIRGESVGDCPVDCTGPAQNTGRKFELELDSELELVPEIQNSILQQRIK